MKQPLKCVNFGKDLVVGKIYYGIHLYDDLYKIEDEAGFKITVVTGSSKDYSKDLKHRCDWVKC